MLKKIVEELTDIENEAVKIMENAHQEAQNLIEAEKNKQERIKEELISEFNKAGQEMMNERINNALKKVKEIYNIIEAEKRIIEKDAKDKFDQAVEMVLEQIVK
ncbi:MAG TPA: hypothetical protein PKJ95_00525 [Atribacterota bacterium]|nr:hypothetical protein [Atribacterota bacterium]